VLVLLLETIVDLAVEGELLFRVHEEDDAHRLNGHPEQNPMPVYLSIFAVAQ
jgi:hypothetical protein